MTAGEFATIQFFVDDSSERVVEWVDAEQAVNVAHSLTVSIGARLGTTRRVIITDGGDFTVFQWEYGKGVTYTRPTTPSRGGLSPGPSKP